MVYGEQLRQVEFTTDALVRAPVSKFAAVTARAAGAPTALIHLADGDQLRLAGGSGLPPGWQVIRQAPAASTLAGLVIGHAHPLIITDLDEDPRVPQYAPSRVVNARAYAGFPIRDPQGEIVGVCAVVDYRPRQWTPAELAGVDEGAQACTAFVAEQHAHEETDRQRLFLDAMLENLHTGVAACDADGRLMFTNQAIRRLSGGTPSDGMIRSWAPGSPLIHADGSPMPVEDTPLLRALAGQRLRDVEVTAQLPGKRDRIVSTDAQPITAADGRRIGAVIAARDITDLRRAERFRATELAVSDALAHAPSVQQAGPRVLQAVCATLGWPYAELWLVDQPADTLIPAAQYTADGPAAGDTSELELEHGDALTGAAWRTGKAVWIADLDADAGPSAPRPWLRTGLAIPASSGGKVLAVLSLFADVVEEVTDPLLALLSGIAAHIGEYLERRRAEELALALARSKDEYLALIGHELRTPLTSIATYIELMRDSEPAVLVDELPDIIDVLSRNSDTMRHIIDELLDLSALDSGHAELACAPVNLSTLVHAVATAAQPTADAAGITVHLNLSAGVRVTGDPQRLRQVVTHLIDNAINHSSNGGHITVTTSKPAATIGQLDVTDTGVGVPVDDHDQLFTRFYRSSRTRERRIPGAGLGLAISRAIIERHHGSIRLIPREQPGAHISVRLPVDQP